MFSKNARSIKDKVRLKVKVSESDAIKVILNGAVSKMWKTLASFKLSRVFWVFMLDRPFLVQRDRLSNIGTIDYY